MSKSHIKSIECDELSQSIKVEKKYKKEFLRHRRLCHKNL